MKFQATRILFKIAPAVASLAFISATLLTSARISSATAAELKVKQKTDLKFVSMAPSNTELLFSVGAGKQIVGVCSSCDHAGVANTARVGSFVSINLERLARLKPDMVLLVSGQEELAAKIKPHHFHCVTVDNSHLDDIGKNLRRVGELSGHPTKGDAAAIHFERSMKKLSAIIAKSKNRPKVFYCVWPQPLMTVGRNSFLNEIITACGGTNIAADIVTAYPRYSLERLMISNPDIIIMPFEARNQSFLRQAPWNRLKAVKEKKVYYLPDARHDMLSRPTLRVIKGMAWLAALIHPEIKAELEGWAADGEMFM